MNKLSKNKSENKRIEFMNKIVDFNCKWRMQSTDLKLIVTVTMRMFSESFLLGQMIIFLVDVYRFFVIDMIYVIKCIVSRRKKWEIHGIIEQKFMLSLCYYRRTFQVLVEYDLTVFSHRTKQHKKRFDWHDVVAAANCICIFQPLQLRSASTCKRCS